MQRRRVEARTPAGGAEPPVSPRGFSESGAGGRPLIYLVGCGPMGVQQMTLETVVALKSCAKVFLESQREGQEHTWGDLYWLRQWGVHVDAEVPLDGPPEALARRVLSASGGKPAGLILLGNPSFFSPAETLRQFFEEAGARCIAFTAVSSFDCVLSALQGAGLLDCPSGSQFLHAQTVTLSSLRLNPAMGCLIFRWEVMKHSEPKRLRDWLDRLARDYGPKHLAVVVRCGLDEDLCHVVDLPGLGRPGPYEKRSRLQEDGNYTVYIPPRDRPPAGRPGSSLRLARPRLGGPAQDVIEEEAGSAAFRRRWQRHLRARLAAPARSALALDFCPSPPAAGSSGKPGPRPARRS